MPVKLGLIINGLSEPRYVPPQEPKYHSQLETEFKDPPVEVKVVDCPTSKVFGFAIAEFGAVEF